MNRRTRSTMLTEPAPSTRDPAESPSAPREAFSILRRRGPWRDALRRRMLAIADLLAVALACLLCIGISETDALLLAVALLPFWLLAAKLHGLYDRDHRVLRHLTVDELPSLVSWATTGSAVYLFLAISL